MPNRLRLLTLILAAALALPACVSSALAERNLANVAEIGEALVTVDPEAAPLVDRSLETATELVEATGTLAQLSNFGVPPELPEENFDNVKLLTQRWEEAAPDQAALDASRPVVTRAKKDSAELAGRAVAAAGIREAAQRSPWGGIVSALSTLAAAAGGIYAAVRGPKHLGEWYAEKKSGKAAAKPVAPGAAPPSA